MIRAVIVEDDLMVSSINKQYISLIEDIHVAANFYNGTDAWVHIAKNAVDLVILDVYIPGINGLELLKKIRAANLPVEVIMVTAANDAESLGDALRLGVLDYLVKPFSFERFSAAIQKCLQRRQALQGGNDISQPVIDRMLGGETGNKQPELLKGIQDKTLGKMRGLLQENSGSMLTCDEIAAMVGLSRVTVRRYMNYLIDAGEVVCEVDYQTGGRPSMKYRYLFESDSGAD